MPGWEKNCEFAKSAILSPVPTEKKAVVQVEEGSPLAFFDCQKRPGAENWRDALVMFVLATARTRR